MMKKLGCLFLDHFVYVTKLKYQHETAVNAAQHFKCPQLAITAHFVMSHNRAILTHDAQERSLRDNVFLLNAT